MISQFASDLGRYHRAVGALYYSLLLLLTGFKVCLRSRGHRRAVGALYHSLLLLLFTTVITIHYCYYYSLLLLLTGFTICLRSRWHRRAVGALYYLLWVHYTIYCGCTILFTVGALYYSLWVHNTIHYCYYLQDSQFASDLGGTAGLWVGASALTVMEIIDLLIQLAVFPCKRHNRQPDTRPPYS